MSRKKPDPPPIEGYVDTHFHTLHSLRKGLSRQEILNAAFASGMSWGIDIATGLDDLPERISLAEMYPGLYLTVGCYPSYAEDTLSTNLMSELEHQARSHAKIVGVGEIGLDYHWNYGTPDRQRDLLIRQIGVANRSKLPVVIHCREAQDDLLEILREHPPECKGVIHCFAGDYQFAAGCLDLGMLISFAGNLTYKNAQGLRDVLLKIPASHLLLETDAPYLTPVPCRGRTNRPDLVRYTYQCAAELKEMPVVELARIINENGRRLFNLPE